MTDMGTTVLSVRGDARLVVPPDLVTLSTQVSATGDDKATALRDVTAHLNAITDALAALGGVAQPASDSRVPLGWRTHSVQTHQEWDKAGRKETGRIHASAEVMIEVRDFALLPSMNAVLAEHDALSEFGTSWTADADNAGWPQVRAQAIEAAIQKGRDYAAALGGTLTGIEHIADAGLLGSGDPRAMRMESGAGFAGTLQHRTSSAEGGGAPTLDPVPITLLAVIDARFTASVPPLT